MVKYNLELINTHYKMIELFMLEFDKSILDISYKIDKAGIIIQIVLLEGYQLNSTTKDNVKLSFKNIDITFNMLYLTKKQFNENKGDWNPKYYQWLDYLLYSKAEIL